MSRPDQPAGKLIAAIRAIGNDGLTRYQYRAVVLGLLACVLLVLTIVDLVH